MRTPNDFQRLYNEGMSLVNAGEYSRAIPKFEHVLMSPDLPVCARVHAHYGIVKSIIDPTKASTIKECLQKLSVAEREALRKHVEEMHRLVGQLSDEEFQEESTNDAYNYVFPFLAVFHVLGTNPDEYGKRKQSACFIATVCMDNQITPEVLLLCSFRDRVLKKTKLGRSFIAVYYMLSPGIASWLENHDALRALVRSILIRPIVQVIKKLWCPCG